MPVIASSRSLRLSTIAAAALACLSLTARAQSQSQSQPVVAPSAAASAAARTSVPTTTLPTVTIRASADASAGGLQPAYAGGQVARGGRVGILGSQDMMDTPFSITAYTNEFIQDRQAKSVGDVLLNDSTVRVARGFGNFQESYFIRGFLLSSDDVAYNGLYSLLPRQYIAAELFERVEVLRGASAFMTGASPGGDGIGGAINLLPKRAPNEPLTRFTGGWSTGNQWLGSADIARRFGPDDATGVRFNASRRQGGTAIDDEHAKLDLLTVGIDWHDSKLRLSGDIGWQDNKLNRTRPNISLSGLTAVPKVPDGKTNFAQPWTYSNERDTFGTLRAEYDLNASVTAWAAYGLRRSSEANSLANPTVTDAGGTASTYRFDNTRKDHVDTGELGMRGKARTGPVSHEWVASYSYFELRKSAPYEFDFGNQQITNIYAPTPTTQLPAFSTGAGFGGVLSNPQPTGRTRLSSLAVGDTLGFLDDTLKLTVGLRRQTLAVASFDPNTSAVAPPNYTAVDQTRTSPMASLLWRATKQLSAYANYVEGLTQGETASGFPPPANLGQSLPPYVSKQKEVGLKYDGGRIGGSLALFDTRRPSSIRNAANVQVQDGEDKHRGLEASVFGLATQGLRVLGGATWLQAKQESTGVAATTGKRVIGVPKWLANAGVEWDVPGVEGLSLDTRAVYTGSSYADATNTLNVPGWTRFDIGGRYEMRVQGRPVTVRARVDNLTNRNYWASVGGYPGSGYLVVGNPRTVTVSASVDF